MRRDDLKIHEPCHADWDAMTGDETRRHCAECQLDVHHLSGMTRRQAERTLRANEGKLCVRYAVDAAGTLQFRPARRAATSPRAQQRGAAALVARAAALAGVLGGLTAGCDIAALSVAHAMATKGDSEIQQLMGEPAISEPFMGDAIIQGGLEPYPYEVPSEGSGTMEGTGSPDATLLQQEQQAAQQLEPFGIGLEEEELVGCEGEDLTEATTPVAPAPEPMLMGRIAPHDLPPLDQAVPKPR